MRLSYILIFIYLISLVQPLEAQDYQCFRSDRRYSFENNYHFKVNSITERLGDSILILSNHIWKKDSSLLGECYNATGGSIIGSKVLIGKDSMDYFFNLIGDTIKINKKAILGHKWVLYSDSSLIIKGHISNHDTLSFLNQIDSVKTISFEVYDRNGVRLTHHLDTLNVFLSREFGLVQTLNFRFFPELDGYMYLKGPDSLRQLRITGLRNPDIGNYDIYTFDVYDFNVGDELHVEDYKYEKFDFWNNYLYIRTKKLRYTYLSRKDYLPDSIVYMVNLKSRTIENWKDSSSNVYSSKINKQVIVPISYLDSPSGSPIVVSGTIDISELSTNGQSKTNLSVLSTLYGDTNCYSYGTFTGCTFPYSPVYTKGLGGPYDWCEDYFTCCSRYYRRLVYYKKGSKEWGKPFTDVGIDEIRSENISIYPNPASSYVNIAHPLLTTLNGYQVELYNLQGALVSSIIPVNKKGKEIQLDLSELSEGTYLIHCFNSQNSWTGRVEVVR